MCGHLEVHTLLLELILVTLWEIFNDGALPWRELLVSEVQVLIRNFFQVPEQGLCPADIYLVIAECLRVNPDERPSFENVLNHLEIIFPQTQEITFLESNGSVGDEERIYSAPASRAITQVLNSP